MKAISDITVSEWLDAELQAITEDGPELRRIIACSRNIHSITWQQMKSCYLAGYGLRAIARSMSIPEGTVLAHAFRNNWTRDEKVT